MKTLLYNLNLKLVVDVNLRIEVYFDNQVCQNAIQPTSFSWFFNNIRIKPTSQKFTVIDEADKSVLVINDVQKAHNGVYTVQAVGKNLQPRAELKVESKQMKLSRLFIYWLNYLIFNFEFCSD